MLYRLCILLFLTVSCNSSLDYPEGGYNFPATVLSKDSNNYFLPLIKVLPPKDSFSFATDSVYFKAFDEPNLSLKPYAEEIFRFAYDAVSSNTIIISLTKNKIVIKKVVSGRRYPEEDTSRLSVDERAQYALLRWTYPINEYKKKHKSPDWK